METSIIILYKDIKTLIYLYNMNLNFNHSVVELLWATSPTHNMTNEQKKEYYENQEKERKITIDILLKNIYDEPNNIILLGKLSKILFLDKQIEKAIEYGTKCINLYYDNLINKINFENNNIFEEIAIIFEIISKYKYNYACVVEQNTIIFICEKIADYYKTNEKKYVLYEIIRICIFIQRGLLRFTNIDNYLINKNNYNEMAKIKLFLFDLILKINDNPYFDSQYELAKNMYYQIELYIEHIDKELVDKICFNRTNSINL